MAEPIPLAEFYAEYGALRADLFKLADMMPDGAEFKASLEENDKKIQELVNNREAKVKECHPDGKHWPPHEECPLCQKVAQKWDKLAKDRCKEMGLPETEENLDRALSDCLASRL